DLVAVSVPMAVRTETAAELSGARQAGQPPLVAELVSDNFFSKLGVRARLGRVPDPDEGRTFGSAPVLFLSDAGWRAHFNADSAGVGGIVTLNGVAFTIGGVAEPSFIGIGNPPEVPDFWAPLGLQVALTSTVDWVAAPTIRRLQLIGHLRPAVGLSAASSR